MHLNAKKITFLGVLLALNEILLVLGGVFEISTLFFIAAGAFCVGIAVREYGVVAGGVYLTAGVILSLLIVPNKMYCLTYTLMSLYILFSEFAWIWLCKRQQLQVAVRIKIFWIIRYAIFNILYIPAVLLFPALFITKEITLVVLLAAIAAGQVALFLFEKGYCYFQGAVWNKFRKHI